MWKFSNAVGQDALIQRDDKGDVGNGVLGQSGFPLRKQHIPRRVGPFQVAGEWHADYCADAAAIDRVALNDDDGSPVSRFRSRGLFEIRPPHLRLFDYHSTRRMTRRAARLLNGSDSSPTAATT